MDKRPTINEIARGIPCVLNEARGTAYSGNVEFYKDEIDVKGDGTLWAIAEYIVDYNWTYDPGDRETPPTSDYDVTDVHLVGAKFNTDDGEEVEVSAKRSTEILVDYFWRNQLESDSVLSDKIHEQAIRYER
jgi:hypothetical protein